MSQWGQSTTSLVKLEAKIAHTLTINDFQHEIAVVKQEITELKNEFKNIKSDNNNLKQELLLLKIDQNQSDNKQEIGRAHV